MKSFTDLEQSQKLAEILPLESADMFHAVDAEIVVTTPYITYLNGERNIPAYKGAIPCWSLAALLELMPRSIKSEKNGQTYLSFHRGYEDNWMIAYSFGDIDRDYLEIMFEQRDPVDAAFEMVVWLKENKYI